MLGSFFTSLDKLLNNFTTRAIAIARVNYKLAISRVSRIVNNLPTPTNKNKTKPLKFLDFFLSSNFNPIKSGIGIYTNFCSKQIYTMMT